MGLPLFMEPVESDLSNKTAAKAGAASPPRADSRRTSRSEIRDRRNSIRRAGVRIYSPAQRTMPRNARERLLPWVESPMSRDQDPIGAAAADRRSGMFREALREMTSSDERRRERLEERMSSLFNNNWRDNTLANPPAEHENMSEGVDLGWWSLDPRLTQARRSRLALPAQSQVDRLPDGPLPPPPPPPPRRSHLHHHVDSATGRAGDVPAFEPRLVRSLSARQMMPNRRAALGMDGLGDRERSLSPEVWDTLLSTLTPDPQPPSAGSSFASVSASQTAGPSSGTPTSAPDASEEAFLEAPCESGCENSDMEMDEPDYQHPDYALIRRRRRQATAAAASMAATNDFASMANYNAGVADAAALTAHYFAPSGRTTRQINTPNGPLTIYESTGRVGQVPDSSRSSRPANSHDQQNTWLGHLSVGASGEEDRGADGPRQHQDEPSSSTHANPMASEDDWAGMQRIVRSLARREDIPDEWWADAGLSRTLRQGETGTSSNTFRQNIGSM